MEHLALSDATFQVIEALLAGREPQGVEPAFVAMIEETDVRPIRDWLLPGPGDPDSI